MGIKATLQPDHIPVNKYQLLILGMPALNLTKISGIEEEVDVVDLPDRTRASGGNAQAFEFTCELPMHHGGEVAAMEIWYEEGKDPVSSTYKKAGTLLMTSGTGGKVRSHTITGMWLSKRKLPDLDFDNEGEMAVIEWTVQADNIAPL